MYLETPPCESGAIAFSMQADLFGLQFLVFDSVQLLFSLVVVKEYDILGNMDVLGPWQYRAWFGFEPCRNLVHLVL